MLRTSRDSSGIDSLKFSFFRWHELVLIRTRCREKPFLIENDESSLATRHFMHSVSNLVKSSLDGDLNCLYAQLLSTAIDVTDASEVYLFIVDPKTDFLHLKQATVELNEQNVVRRPTDSGILSLCAREKCVYSCSKLLSSKHYEPSSDRLTFKGNTQILTAVMAYPIFAKSKAHLFDPTCVLEDGECMLAPNSDNAEMVALLYLNNKQPRYGSCFIGIKP